MLGDFKVQGYYLEGRQIQIKFNYHFLSPRRPSPSRPSPHLSLTPSLHLPLSPSHLVIYKVPRFACSRSILSNKALKLPLPNDLAPLR